MGKFIGTTGLLYLWNKIKSIIPTKVSDLDNDSGFTSNVGTITGITMNGASKGTSGVVNLGTVITSHQDISGKLDKTTFEWNKQLSIGSKGKVCLGKFFMYDSNVTIELSLTTLETYNATIIIASQNLNRTSNIGSIRANVYSDENNSITPLLSIFRPNPSTDNGSVEVYANLPGWSKCLVHVQGINLETKTEGGVQYVGAYDILSSVSAIPTEISGKIILTNDGTVGNNKVCNLLKASYYSKVYNGTSSQFLKADGSVDSNTYLTSYNETDPTVPSWAKASTKPSYTASEVGALPDDTQLFSGDYNDLTNKPTIPSAVTESTVSGWGFTKNTGTVTYTEDT